MDEKTINLINSCVAIIKNNISYRPFPDFRKCTFPYDGMRPTKILDSEKRLFIENQIVFKSREKDKQIDFTYKYPYINITMPLFDGKRGNYDYKRQSNN